MTELRSKTDEYGTLMTAPFASSVPASFSERIACDEEIRTIVTSYTDGESTDQRRWQRSEFRQPIVLAPVNLEQNEIGGSPMIVEGNDISVAGLSFTHTTRLPCRHVVAGLRDAFGVTRSFVVSLTWTRSLPNGKFQSGGRFLRQAAVGVVNEAMDSHGETA